MSLYENKKYKALYMYIQRIFSRRRLANIHVHYNGVWIQDIAVGTNAKTNTF